MRGLLERVALRSLKIHKGSAHQSAPDTCASIRVDPWRKECFSLQLELSPPRLAVGAWSCSCRGAPTRASSACGNKSIARRERVTHTASLAECCAPDTCASIRVDPWRKRVCFSLQLGAESLELLYQPASTPPPHYLINLTAPQIRLAAWNMEANCEASSLEASVT